MKSSFNTLERFIAKILSKFPAIKKLIKKFYSHIVFYSKKKSYTYKCFTTPIAFFENSKSESFYGYYDKSPLSITGNLISHVSTYPTTNAPTNKHPIELQVYNIHKNELLFSTPSLAYNWQQGTRAHWLNEDLMIFNDFDVKNKNYCSRIISISQKREIKHFELPVQDSFGTEFFLSINYQRLLTLRPDYGYRCLPKLTAKELSETTNDGIWIVDYKTGKNKLLYSLEQMIQTKPQAFFFNAQHKCNHIMISPSGLEFIFIHRCYHQQKRFDRLLLGTRNGDKIRVINDSGMVSHYSWLNDNSILGYMRTNNKDSYWKINIKTLKFEELFSNKLSSFGDGHPSVHGDWFITDTYPDKSRMQHLILCNWKTGDIKHAGEFFHGFEYSDESRCDLHPRFSLTGDLVFFDSVFDGKRKQYMLNMKI